MRTVYGESVQNTVCRSASHEWMNTVIKMTRKTLEVPNLLRRCETTGNGYDPPSDTRRRLRGRLRFESELAAGREELKMRVNTSQDNVKMVEICSPHLGWAPNRILAQDTNMWRQNQLTNTWELQQKIRKSIQGRCLFSLFSSWHDLFVQLTRAT